MATVFTTQEEKGNKTMEKAEPMLKTVKEAANLLNVSAFWLYRGIQAGQVPAFRFGRKILLDINAVLATMRIQ